MQSRTQKHDQTHQNPALILSRTSGQADRIALPLPDRLRGGAANKVIVPLIQKGFLDEVEADIRNGEPRWRKTGDGHGTTLIITDAGLEAIGVETATPKPKKRAGTKQACVGAARFAPPALHGKL